MFLVLPMMEGFGILMGFGAFLWMEERREEESVS